MHIGFITSEYPHPQVKHAAGIATSIKNLAVALVKRGVVVSVFVYHQDADAIIEDNDVRIHLIKTKRFGLFTWYYYRKHIQYYVNTIINKEKIDLIEAPDWTGITAFMRLQVPLIIRLHGSDAYFCKLDKRKQKFKNYVFEKAALKGAKGYIAPTVYAGQETAKLFGLSRDKIKTIHYGLQLDHFQNNTPEVYHRHTLLYIGTIIRKKGVLELAEIFNTVVASNPDAKLILIGGDAPDIATGDSSTYALMDSLFTTAAQKRVHYLGKIPYTEVQEHIKKSHVCVFPSFAETLGMVTIESMALQKPVVNTSIGWAQELIDDGVNGYLVHPTAIMDYSSRILELFNDETLCLEIGKGAREKVSTTFNIDTLAATNINYYQSQL
ncbi:glycosyltransferase family 4 protein [Bizionia saleffrena]|uniref:Glycosyltransferase family 4 protein n=1 Tax=Bizionia saleffrena TaxID=291189 RepID=A0A8H2LJ22_9FLAO|nr:glycosyltransferase family 4 protein [Bizionia saleffrena]TYB80157.1 glycosyltransferase family 4 protein [Bizionia saleffrena]